MVPTLYENGKVNNEIEAYLLGFFYADGFIAHEWDKTRRPHVFGILLSYKDKIFLNKIAKLLKTKTKKRILKLRGKDYDAIELKIFSVVFVERMMKLGIVPRKTYESNDAIIQKVPKRLLNHFIRGFFDGDGSIWKSKNNYGFGIVSLNKKLLERIEEAFSKNGYIHSKKVKCINSRHYRLTYIGNIILTKIGNFLYKNATIFLKRKKKMFDKIVIKNSKQNQWSRKVAST